jgi:hypothetical protein
VSIWDQAAQSGTGRWHVRLVSPTNVVIFDDFTASSLTDAFGQAAAAHPGYTIEWAVLEPNTYGVFANPGATRQA